MILKKYSFFGITLEMILVMGLFFVLLLVILAAARIEWMHYRKKLTANGVEEDS
ncbi:MULTISPECIES: hypothetical protein [unclassified Paenibacillus]|uniref:hypothetical protein n=1 Tax=unclassified Paenibacillus TaxID=185978 RepID=UPI001AE56FC7|nr:MULTISPECIES: hypothetical protein [unclassified Paenibacillus]MBP1156601.1 hypothetical protein [Paenibacillus sp. PvP091]MBP1172661.1 hypothetical protein [Paenibacillus sp. PvR098]MBP2439041.1 hypothetical protein [Paenibacillus sp. PvP052]